MSDLIDRQMAKDAIDMALDHIDHVPSWVYDNLLNALNEVTSVKPTHPTPSNALGALDCVSREDLTKGIETYFGDLPITVHYDMLALAQKLPSVQSRKGRWIEYEKGIKITSYKCSECGRIVRDDTGYEVSEDYPFCHCGADMREGDAE